MTTSNLSLGDSAPFVSGASASRIRNTKRGRLFITDFYYLKDLFTRRKFEPDPLAPFAIQQSLGDWRHPADPIFVGIGFVHANDSITRLGSVGFANRDAGAETNDVRRSIRRPN